MTDASGTTRNGFTMIELLVAVVILGLMIVSAGAVLTQANKVITISQSKMAANAEAAAIAQAIRNDIRALTKDGGFLAIIAPDGVGDDQIDTTSPGALIFTAMGSFASRSGQLDADDNPISSGAAVICYSIRKNTSKDDARSVLCREANLLTKHPDKVAWTDDVMNMNPAELTAKNSRAMLDQDILTPLANEYLSVATTPKTLTDIQSLWPVLAANCTRFSVQWLDKDGDWRGFDYKLNDDKYELEINPSDDGASWETAPIGSFGDDAIEPPEGSRNTPGVYTALWSHHYNQTDSPKWPKAIKVRFTLTRPIKGEQTADYDYEVVCDLNHQ